MFKYPICRPCIGRIEKELVNQCLDTVSLSQGAMVRRFEKDLANYLDTKHVVATTSGTTALHLVLAALDIGPGDEVLVPDLTFVATANAVDYTGAKAIPVDIDTSTWCISTEDARKKITARTRAIIPVHLYGVACNMMAIARLASQFNLRVIEDAAEGFTGTYNYGEHLGTLGTAGIYSFYGNKVITCGEGGAVSTNDDALFKRLAFLRGQALDPVRRYYHPEVGYNYRMTDLQAALGVGQLTHLQAMLVRRKEIFEIYRQRLCYSHGIAPVAPPYTRTAPWVFTFRPTPHVTRDALIARLAERGIETRPGFVPLHRLPMYRQPDSFFPVASLIGDTAISLPTYPELTAFGVHEICDEVITCMSIS